MEVTALILTPSNVLISIGTGMFPENLKKFTMGFCLSIVEIAVYTCKQK